MAELSEEQREQLDGIVQDMISNNESEDDIQFVVDDFKSKYAGKTTPTDQDISVDAIEVSESTDLELEDTSSESEDKPEEDVEAEGFVGNVQDIVGYNRCRIDAVLQVHSPQRRHG